VTAITQQSATRQDGFRSEKRKGGMKLHWERAYNLLHEGCHVSCTTDCCHPHFLARVEGGGGVNVCTTACKIAKSCRKFLLTAGQGLNLWPIVPSPSCNLQDGSGMYSKLFSREARIGASGGRGGVGGLFAQHSCKRPHDACNWPRSNLWPIRISPLHSSEEFEFNLHPRKAGDLCTILLHNEDNHPPPSLETVADTRFARPHVREILFLICS